MFSLVSNRWPVAAVRFVYRHTMWLRRRWRRATAETSPPTRTPTCASLWSDGVNDVLDAPRIRRMLDPGNANAGMFWRGSSHRRLSCRRRRRLDVDRMLGQG